LTSAIQNPHSYEKFALCAVISPIVFPTIPGRGHGQSFMAIPALAQVMVQGLPSSANEEFLEQLFDEVRPVHRPNGVVIKRRQDRRGQPVTFAFVTFESREDADTVIAELNYTKLDGAPIRIVRADSETRAIVRSGKGNLFVKNLDPTIEDSQLHEAFANFGEIVSCKIATDDSHVSRGYGYVQFRREVDASQAQTDLKDASINGRPLMIEAFKKRPLVPKEQVYTNVYVKNLPASIATDEDLADLFRDFGEIASAKLQIRQAADGTGQFFGFCDFKSHEDAVNAVAALNGKELAGKTLECVRFKTQDERKRDIERQSELWKQNNYERYKGRNLYVRGFDESFTDEGLRDLFSQFGEIESAVIQRDDKGVSKKFGFVCFKNKEDAQRCLTHSPLLHFPDSGKQVYLADVVPATRRKQMNIQNKAQQARVQGEPQRPLTPVPPPITFSPYYPAAGFPIAAPVPIPSGVQTPPPQPGISPLGPYAGDPIAPAAFMPFALTQRERLREEILEHPGPNQQSQLQRLKDLSDDQVLSLTKDQPLFISWMQLA
jgi:polyadenylate-binding protein